MAAYKLNFNDIYTSKNGFNYIGSYDKLWFIEEDFLNTEFIEKFFSFICDRCSGDLRDYILKNKHFDLNLATMNELIETLDCFSSVLLRDFAKYTVNNCRECTVIDNTIDYETFSVILFNENGGH